MVPLFSYYSITYIYKCVCVGRSGPRIFTTALLSSPHVGEGMEGSGRQKHRESAFTGAAVKKCHDDSKRGKCSAISREKRS